MPPREGVVKLFSQQPVQVLLHGRGDRSEVQDIALVRLLRKADDLGVKLGGVLAGLILQAQNDIAVPGQGTGRDYQGLAGGQSRQSGRMLLALQVFPDQPDKIAVYRRSQV